MTHELCLPNDLHTACDFVATVIHVLEGSCDHIHVVVCIYTACNAETEKVESAETVLTSHRVTVCKDITDLTTTYTCLDIKLDGESLSRELLLRDLVEHAVCVNEDCVTTDRTLIRDAILIKLSSKILYLTDTCLDSLKLCVLIKTYSKSSHITTVHTTISEEAFEWDTESLSTLVPVLVTSSDETTHVDETVLL